MPPQNSEVCILLQAWPAECDIVFKVNFRVISSIEPFSFFLRLMVSVVLPLSPQHPSPTLSLFLLIRGQYNSQSIQSSSQHKILSEAAGLLSGVLERHFATQVGKVCWGQGQTLENSYLKTEEGYRTLGAWRPRLPQPLAGRHLSTKQMDSRNGSRGEAWVGPGTPVVSVLGVLRAQPLLSRASNTLRAVDTITSASAQNCLKATCASN